MKRVGLLGILFFVSTLSFAQLNDDFSDGDFTSNPVWSGEDTSFIINGSNQLQSDGPSATVDIHLSTPNTQFQNTQWSFYAFLDLSLSSSNNARVYLMSDNANLEDSLHGYYVQLGGESGSVDGIHLYRQDGNSKTKIIDGPDGTMGSDPNTASIKVLRDAVGNWSLLADTSGGTNYTLQGTAFDDSYLSTTHFGVHVSHTSTRRTLFYFDDFVIEDMPVTLIGASPLSNNQLEVSFTEDLELTSAQDETNYSINNGIGIPQSAAVDQGDNSKIILDLGSNLVDGTTYILTVNNVVSVSGDTVAPNSQTSFSFFKEKNFQDIIITEIFPDPDPSIGLPADEFVEFFNTTNDSIDLGGFQFTDASTTVATLENYNLAPNDYVIICANGDTSLFQPYGNVLGISNFPSLNNSGDDLQLFDNTGKLIDAVSYLDSWYGDVDKEDGGWTLEIVDPNNPCGEENNWRASEDPSGGTPGKVNSINANNPDLTAPQVVKAIAVEDNAVQVFFDEPIDPSSYDTTSFSIDNGVNVISALIEPDAKSVVVRALNPFQNKVLYTITVSDLSDCIGNQIGSSNTAQFALPEEPVAGDIILNEVLFDAQSGGDDYVEIYNNSDKYIELSKFYFIEFDIDMDTIEGFDKEFTTERYVIAPYEYAWLTENYQDVVSFFPKAIEENVIITDLPTYSNDEGTVAFGFFNDDSLVTAEKFQYLDDYHYELLDDVDGVSLERVTFDGVTNDANNWHSAAAPDYGTPGFQNSQQMNIDGIEDQITIFPEVFTPDEDGLNDFTTISYSFDENGYTLSITIFDSHGRLIKNVVQNDLVGREGFYQWNGTDNEGQKANVGYHIALIEVFDLAGNTNKFKKKIVVGAKF